MTISDLWQHASEDFQSKVLFVPESVRPPLDDPDLGVDSLDEPEGELLLGLAVRRDPAPVPLDDCGELLEWNLSKRTAVWGACPFFFVDFMKGFHMSITAILIPLLFLGPSHL